MKKFLIFIFFFIGCSKESKTKHPLARVGSSVLLESDIDNNMTEDKVFDFVENWVTEKILIEKARKEGFFEDKKLKKERDLFYNKLILSSFLDNALIKDINISKKEVLDYYNSSKDFFKRKQDEVFVHHFFSKQIEQSRSIKRELLKGKNRKNTTKIRDDYNVEPVFVKKGFSIKEIDNALFESKKIGFIGPIRTELGFHLFDIIKRYNKGSEVGLESSYDEIYQRLLKKKKSNKRKSFVDSLKRNTNIFINSKYRKIKDET